MQCVENRDAIDEKMVDKNNNAIICTRSFYNTYKATTIPKFIKKGHTTLFYSVMCAKLNLR